MGGTGGGLARWWSRPDNFDWLSGYLQARELDRPTRRLMAAIGASLLLVPVNNLWGPPALDLPVIAVVGALAGIAGAVWAARWLTGWPTKKQSIAFAMTGSVAIAVGSLGQGDPLIAMMGCAALTVPGGYLAFFHSAPVAAANFALAVGVGAVAAARIIAAGDIVLALTGYVLVLELNLAVPLAIQIVVGALGLDLRESHRDSLTGLLNRRAIQQAAVGALATGRDTPLCLVLAMVDLDAFKTINDTRGHPVGDAALASVGSALSSSLNKSAVVGRVGGEEFLVVDIVHPEAVDDVGPHLCAVIAGVPFWPPLTASVGTVAVRLGEVHGGAAAKQYHQLVGAADAAMYVAKKAGGNRSHHGGWWNGSR
ncbi:MAG: GGDEF domain-containing protein [Actinomycetota bacterium]|nr:GGDEF domain-containing protein [Actinomycetota bacterium]